MISILLILFISSLTECRWILEIELLSYNNPTSRRSNGQCCDNNLASCGNKCDNEFEFCLLRPGDFRCTYGNYETGVVAFNNDSLTFGDTIGSNNIPNPLIFNGTEWPNNNQIVFETHIFDYDGPNNYDQIDRAINNIILSSINDSFINYNITGNVFTLQTRHRLGCANFYYGSRCEVFCQPHNDDINGHYTCDTQGNIVCNTGYQMNETNCTTPTLAQSSTVTGVAVGVVIPILLLLIAIAVVIAVVTLLGNRRAHQTKNNPTYSTNDTEVSNDYYLMPQDEARYVRNVDNLLYEGDTRLPGVDNTGPSNYSRLNHSEPELHSEIQPPNYSEIPPYNNYSMLSNYSEVQDYSVDINSSQEPLYSLADAPLNDGTTLADLPEGHYEVDPNISK